MHILRWFSMANLLDRGSKDGEDIYNKSISQQCSMSRNIGLQKELDSLVVADTPRVNDNVHYFTLTTSQKSEDYQQNRGKWAKSIWTLK